MTKWEGGCKNGKAQGKGVLRAYDGARAVQIFFGSLDKGEPRRGVIEDSGNFVYGEFAEGKPLDSDDPNVMLAAFEEGIAAAKQVSKSFERVGNTRSAEFYAEKALVLERQLE
ncbi:MAG: hypothetical protein JWN04_5562 [Myxococcaceae bacterium]|nr:hypothetical protein [Myxococcaceae bacterium]